MAGFDPLAGRLDVIAPHCDGHMISGLLCSADTIV